MPRRSLRDTARHAPTSRAFRRSIGRPFQQFPSIALPSVPYPEPLAENPLRVLLGDVLLEALVSERPKRRHLPAAEGSYVSAPDGVDLIDL